jgi:hypothetical protein
MSLCTKITPRSNLNTFAHRCPEARTKLYARSFSVLRYKWYLLSPFVTYCTIYMPHKLMHDWCLFVFCKRLMVSIHTCTKGIGSGVLGSVRFIFLLPNRLMCGEPELKFMRIYFKFAGIVASHEDCFFAVY